MTTKELKQQAKELHQTIYQVGCYGKSDLMEYNRILEELYKRGIEPINKISF
jgi:hypothetical protein